MPKTKARARRSSVWITTEVEVDMGDLEEEGWHHEDDCLKAPAVADLGAAVASLHRQAHPGALSIALCHEEPCRSLTLDQLQQVPE